MSRIHFCETARQFYTPRRSHIVSRHGCDFEVVSCNCCDSSNRVAGDPDYDGDSPQVHVYPLNEAARRQASRNIARPRGERTAHREGLL